MFKIYVRNSYEGDSNVNCSIVKAAYRFDSCMYYKARQDATSPLNFSPEFILVFIYSKTAKHDCQSSEETTADIFNRTSKPLLAPHILNCLLASRSTHNLQTRLGLWIHCCRIPRIGVAESAAFSQLCTMQPMHNHVHHAGGVDVMRLSKMRRNPIVGPLPEAGFARCPRCRPRPQSGCTCVPDRRGCCDRRRRRLAN
jgi:hypothetical protein